MKFGALREKCTARAYRLIVNRANGKTHEEECQERGEPGPCREGPIEG